MDDTTALYFEKFCKSTDDAAKLIDYLTVHVIEDDVSIGTLVKTKKRLILLENEEGEI